MVMAILRPTEDLQNACNVVHKRLLPQNYGQIWMTPVTTPYTDALNMNQRKPAEENCLIHTRSSAKARWTG